jgi:xanthine phosphoribosyltransferase
MYKRTVSWYDLQKTVNKICRDVTLTGWRPDYVVGITRGGLLPAVMISHYFDIPCNTLKVCLRDNEETESNLWMAEDAFAGKKILVVDDINDSGATINWLLKDWPSGCFPNDPKWESIWGDNVRFAVLFDNLASKAQVSADYVGEEINKAEDDCWIDFPYEDWWTK